MDKKDPTVVISKKRINDLEDQHIHLREAFDNLINAQDMTLQAAQPNHYKETIQSLQKDLKALNEELETKQSYLHKLEDKDIESK